MNWLRDNIAKILIILGVTVVVFVIIAIVSKPKQKEEIVSGTKYGELETKLQSAAVNYVEKHKKLLPTSTENTSKITLSTLISNNYIGKMVAVEDKKTKCSGYVEITKLSDDKNEYRYTPYINCGEYYSTKTISKYIIDAETKNGTFERTADAGLYKSNNEYIFRGENPNNYIMLDENLYRIIKIDENGSLQLISTIGTADSYVWDDRYNINRKSIDNSDGINDFVKSRLHDTLVLLYNNTSKKAGEIYFTDTERSYIIPHEYCIGKRSLEDNNIYSGAECKETIELSTGLISLNEYSRASIDTNCVGIYDKSCANYNYFNTLYKKRSYSYVTLTASADNTYQYYRVYNLSVELTKTNNSRQLYPVIYINNKTIYSSGTGTATDPYIIR
jgi:hypothetical protein